jgi:hypothetical protein
VVLEVPFELAGVRVDRDRRRGIEVVAGTLIAEPARKNMPNFMPEYSV